MSVTSIPSKCATIFVTLLIVVAPLYAKPTVSASSKDQLTSLLEGFMANEEIAGGVTLVSSPQGRYVAVTGASDVQTNQRVEPHTRFYAASTGKLFVATAILSAAEEGLLSLDDPMDRYLEGLSAAQSMQRADPVTIRQLLNHTSGLPEYLTDTFLDASYAAPDTRWTPNQALAFAADEAVRPAGEHYSYTNTNYVVLGHILAQLDGTLEASLQQRVFGPAGMATTSVGTPNTQSPDLAHGYDQDGSDVSALAWNSVLRDGPAITTIGDLEAFALALFSQRALLSPDFLEEMLTGSPQDRFYGLGVVIGSDDLGVWYGHAGGYDGFEADLRYYPQHDVVLAYVVNGNQQSDVSFLNTAARWYKQH